MYKLRCERHRKACKICKYNHCVTIESVCNCTTCKINPLGTILFCPCLDLDFSPKYSRCEYFELNKNDHDCEHCNNDHLEEV